LRGLEMCAPVSAPPARGGGECMQSTLCCGVWCVHSWLAFTGMTAVAGLWGGGGGGDYGGMGLHIRLPWCVDWRVSLEVDWIGKRMRLAPVASHWCKARDREPARREHGYGSEEGDFGWRTYGRPPFW